MGLGTRGRRDVGLGRRVTHGDVGHGDAGASGRVDMI